jgi:hypothetical protein
LRDLVASQEGEAGEECWWPDLAKEVLDQLSNLNNNTEDAGECSVKCLTAHPEFFVEHIPLHGVFPLILAGVAQAKCSPLHV